MKSVRYRLHFLFLIFVYACLLEYKVLYSLEQDEKLNESTLVVLKESIYNYYSAGQNVQGYSLDEFIDIVGYSTKEKYWNNFPAVSNALLSQSGDDNRGLSKVKRQAPIPSDCLVDSSSICLDEYIFKGGHGDVWRAHRIMDKTSVNGTNDGDTDQLILKRMKTKNNPYILRCALREIYFGKLLQGKDSFPLFITHFLQDGDYWLVFRDEGSSLQSYLYNAGLGSANRILSPSKAWNKLRTTNIGAASMKSIIFQLISNTEELHRLGIVHRDIKPSNILLQASQKARLLTSDFSSAVDKVTLSKNSGTSFYGENGPTIAEATLEYAPPEVLLSISSEKLDDEKAIPYDLRRPESYDIWGVGMVFLELLLGTPDVFHVDQRTEALITKLLQRKNMNTVPIVKKALLLAGLTDFGIFNRETIDDEIQKKDLKVVRLKKKLSSFSQAVVLATSKIEDSLTRGVSPTNSNPSAAVSVTIDIKDTGLSKDVVSDSSHSSILRDTKAISVENEEKGFDFGPCGLSPDDSEKLLSAIAQAILHRDILGLGFHDKWGLDLLARLLCFDPAQRISMKEALSHAYFHGPYMSAYDATEFATLREMIVHNRRIKALKYSAETPSLVRMDNIEILMDEEDSIFIDIDEDLADEDRLPFDTAPPALSYTDQADIDFQLLNDRLHSDASQYNKDNIHVVEISETQHSNIVHSNIPYSTAFQIQGQLERLRFQCPHCGRMFEDRASCIQHMHSRRHGRYCLYFLDDDVRESSHLGHERILSNNEALLSNIFPPCLSDRSFGVRDDASGWCDLQGKRRYMEDFHAIYHHIDASYAHNYTLFAVFDGHSGSFAARFATHHLHVYYQEYLDAIIRYPEIRDEIISVAQAEAVVIPTEEDKLALEYAFRCVDRDLSTAFSSYGEDIPIGGTTATVLIIQTLGSRSSRLLVGHVGDSRLVFCSVRDKLFATFSSQLTTDHTASNPREALSLLQRGGNISVHDNTPRVQGDLIVTRSLGDSYLGDIISSSPDIFSIDLVPLTQEPLHFADKPLIESPCGDYFSFLWQRYVNCLEKASIDKKEHIGSCQRPNSSAFAILASDGLWDVMDNEEAVEFICTFLLENQYTMEIYLDYAQSLDNDDSQHDELMHDNYAEEEFEIFQAASRLLAYEALLRGSVDNIGVSVVDLSHA